MASDYSEVLITSHTDGSALTAAARATCLPAQAIKTLPPNFFDYIGKKIVIDAWGRISCAVTTPGTARFDVAFGGTATMDSLAINLNIVAKTNVPWHLRIEGTLRAEGTSANLMWSGYWQSEAVIASPLPTVGGSGMVLLPYNSAPAVSANFDATASQVIDLRFTQTVATGSLTCHQYTLSSPN